MGHIKRFDEINEGIIDWDAGNTKAVQSQRRAFMQVREYSITMNPPISEITTTDDGLFFKLRDYCRTHGIEFKYDEKGVSNR